MVSWDFFDPSGVNALSPRVSWRRRTTFTQRQASSAAISLELMPPVVERSSFESYTSSRSSIESHATELEKVADPDPNAFDFEKTLRRAIEQREAEHIPARKLGVLFKDLRVTVRSSEDSSYQSTMGSVLNPLVWIKNIRASRTTRTRDILTGFSGVVKPGEMLLVLGRPGSGCSTLLKSLANQTDEYDKVSGERHYDSFSPDEIKNYYRGDVTYCAEDDIHFPSLTVSQTLSFAAKLRAPHTRLGNQSREIYVKRFTEILMTVFGLRHARDTPVGDAALRGVSGGEKKRVSIAEALAARSLLGCWDNSTRGLDASTALEFVRALRIATDLAQLTSIVSIYQAGEALYELFDKVCVIGEGRCYFFGRADHARAYFEALGFVPGERQTTSDFLVAVTDPNGRTTSPTHPFPIPRTAIEFETAFQSSIHSQLNKSEMMAYWHELVGRPDLVDNFNKSISAEKAKRATRRGPYTVNTSMQLKAVMLRRLQILRGNPGVPIVQLITFVIVATVVGTVFYHIKDNTAAFMSRGGILFFSLLYGSLSAMAEIPALYSQKPIVHRHQKGAMYHPFVESLALTVVQLPITFVIQFVFSVIVYFLVGLQHTARQYFTFFASGFLTTVALQALARSLTSMFKSKSSAQGVSGIVTLVSMLYMGYVLPETTMIRALKWLVWVNPLRYGFEILMTNEFHTLNATCSALIPFGPAYENVTLANKACVIVGSISGQSTVLGSNYARMSYGYAYSHLLRDAGALVAYTLFFVAVFLILTETNTSSSAETSVTLFKRGSRISSAATSGSPTSENSQYPPLRAASQGHVVPSGGLLPTRSTFTWRNLTYTVPLPSGPRRLLDGISGFVAPGKVTALMGESGAGKTTLLNVLAGRQGVGVVGGDRLIHGQPLQADFESQTGYCQQTDTHTPEQTVREALLFSAMLRQPKLVSVAEKAAHVESCLRMCGLAEHANAIVGTLGVEHRKRTTIGVELAAKPKLLLFLDEPTSGLDSQSALAIMKFLRTLAENGQAILCTIHQPSNELFQSFDRLLLLKKGGRTVYFGDIGRECRKVIKYFESNGARQCIPGENPAEYILDVIGAGATATSVLDWGEKWSASEEDQKLKQRIEELHSVAQPNSSGSTATHSEFATDWAYQFKILLMRNFQCAWRNPPYLMAKIILNIFSGLLIGFTFFHVTDSLQGTQNKLFAIFMSLVVCVSLSNKIQVVFIDTRNVYEVRERLSRMYSWTAMLASQIVAEVPWNVLGGILYFITWFWTVGYETSRAGYTFLVIAIIFPIYFTTFAQMVAAMASDVVVSALIFTLLFAFTVTFNGVLQPYSHLGWWKWMYRVSPLTYLIEGVVGQAIGNQYITCAPHEFAIVAPPSGKSCQQYMATFISSYGGYLQNPDSCNSCQYCAARTTDEFLAQNFNIFYAHRWRNVGILLVYIVVNIAGMYLFTFLRMRKGNLLGIFRSKK
ncbi:hypothetical protein BD410DRAFT_752633 [Rickenella mellea]|uniref:ABC transporter domain-containing protein n=1 Tax=Rickenella mellea TaxID=50990 RepID=A0A4Y7PUC1_9AGAM|nr:hypothetical protein BD410DRAFT_752633 [Rickenella mellea]